jgi:hypothetical protein
MLLAILLLVLSQMMAAPVLLWSSAVLGAMGVVVSAAAGLGVLT